MRNDRYVGIPNYESWWNVPVAEVSEMAQVEHARAEWAAMREHERYFLG
jgi:3D-(3,5/4)-trihydroxycyclohexane-1,2-dione acylhydrolase (decyclizing)